MNVEKKGYYSHVVPEISFLKKKKLANLMNVVAIGSGTVVDVRALSIRKTADLPL
jgi:hypothetical protein